MIHLRDQQGKDLFLLHPLFHESPHLQSPQYAQEKGLQIQSMQGKTCKKICLECHVIESFFNKYVLLQP